MSCLPSRTGFVPPWRVIPDKWDTRSIDDMDGVSTVKENRPPSNVSTGFLTTPIRRTNKGIFRFGEKTRVKDWILGLGCSKQVYHVHVVCPETCSTQTVSGSRVGKEPVRSGHEHWDHVVASIPV